MKKTYLLLLILLPILAMGQSIVLEKAVSDSSFPEFYWVTNVAVDSNDFDLYRSGMRVELFKKIETVHYVQPVEGKNEFKLVAIDTTLTEKGLYKYYIEAKVKGKKMKSAVSLGHNFGTLQHPQVVAFKATPLKDRKAVQLDWELNYNQTVSSLALYKSRTYEDGFFKVTDLPAEMTTYTDVIQTANEPWFYFIQINDFFGNQIPSVRIPAFATFAEKPIRPQNIKGELNNGETTLKWSTAGNNIMGYRVFRSIDGKDFIQLNEMAQDSSKKQQYTDTSPALKEAINIKYFVRTVSDGFLESMGSDTLDFYIVENEKVLPPKEIDIISLRKNEAKLLWMPPDEGKVFAYNVYMTDPSGKKVKLTTEPLKMNAYTDSIFREPGKYVYEVEGVGYKNKTSNNTISTVFYRYPENVHIILGVTKLKDGIQVSWTKTLNKHVKNVILYKKSGTEKSTIVKTFSNDNDVVYIDKKITPGETHLYKLIAVLENGEKIVANKGVSIK